MADLAEEEAVRRLLAWQVDSVYAEGDLVGRVHSLSRRRRRRLSALGVAGTMAVVVGGVVAFVPLGHSREATPPGLFGHSAQEPSARYTLSGLPADFSARSSEGRPPGIDSSEAVIQDRYWQLPDKHSSLQVVVYSGPYTPDVLADARAGLDGTFRSLGVRGHTAVASSPGGLQVLAWNEHSDLAVYLTSYGGAFTQAQLGNLAASMGLADEKRPVGDLRSTAAISLATTSQASQPTPRLPVTFDVSFPANSRWSCATGATARFTLTRSSRDSFTLEAVGHSAYRSSAEPAASALAGQSATIDVPWLVEAARQYGQAGSDHQIKIQLTSSDPSARLQSATAAQAAQVTMDLDPACTFAPK